MTTTTAQIAQANGLIVPAIEKESMLDSLGYEAPFVIEKLLKDQVADNIDEAKALFTEVKRYIVLAMLDDTAPWKMYSLRIDHAWHEFVLFTREYTDFCHRFFKRYIHHNPSNAPRIVAPEDGGAAMPSPSFESFRDRYQAFFGVALPDLWYDARTIALRRRVINPDNGRWACMEGENTVDLLDANGDVRLTVNHIAREAIAFVASTGAFYVRELPGNLSDEEKVALISVLVEHRLLRVAP